MTKRGLKSIAHYAANGIMRELARGKYSYSLEVIGLPYSIYDRDGKQDLGDNHCSLRRTQDGRIIETIKDGLSWWTLRDEVAKLILQQLESWNIDEDE